MKSLTRRTLVQLGLSPNYKGFNAIVEAVDLLVKDPHLKITAVYKIVGSRIGSTYSRVERNIRHSIEVIIDRANEDLLYKIFGYNVLAEGTIHNGDFLTCLTMYLQEVHYNG